MNDTQKMSCRDFYASQSRVFSWLEDDLSKEVFLARALNNVSLSNYVQLNQHTTDFLKEKYQIFQEKLSNITEEDTVILWGMGFLGTQLLKRISPHKQIILCDINSQSLGSFEGIPIISPSEMLESIKNRTNVKVIFTSIFWDQALPLLRDVGISEDNILLASEVDEKEQYFDPIVKLNSEEIFADVGAFHGETSVNFAKRVGNNYKKIYLFEPDSSNIDMISKNQDLSALQNVELFPVGLWHEKDTLNFSSGSSKNSKIFDTGDCSVEVNSLDQVLGDVPVTFIKMDIEGAELNALQGGVQIIQKYKPKLAISIYHRAEDLIELPLFIKSIVPEYKLYLRHYSTTWTETVLYAL